jgi:hypothetical protein
MVGTPLLTQPPSEAGAMMGEAVTALRGMMTNAMGTAAAAIPTVGEIAAVFDGTDVGNVDVAETEEEESVDYEGSDDDEDTNEETQDDQQDTSPPISLPVDATNGFNNQNRMALMWTVRHTWASYKARRNQCSITRSGCSH